MADDRDARIAQLEAKNAALREQQQADREESNALRARLQERDYALAEVKAQQRVTAEFLRLLASSPSPLQSVLNLIVQSAVRVLASSRATLRTMEQGGLRAVARADAYYRPLRDTRSAIDSRMVPRSPPERSPSGERFIFLTVQIPPFSASFQISP